MFSLNIGFSKQPKQNEMDEVFLIKYSIIPTNPSIMLYIENRNYPLSEFEKFFTSLSMWTQFIFLIGGTNFQLGNCAINLFNSTPKI